MLEGSPVGAQLVSRHRFRREALLAEQLAHELEGCALVPSALNQDFENLALMIDGTPQVHMLAGDPDDHFVEMPAITRSRTAPPQSPSDRRSEFEHPTANALVGDVEPTLGKQLLHITIAQGETKIQPDGVLDDDRRKAMPTIGDYSHARSLRRTRSDPVGGFPDNADQPTVYVRTALKGRSSSVQRSGSRSSNPDQFVAIRIAEVCEVCAIRTHARRVLD
jgi:hypothetical protein